MSYYRFNKRSYEDKVYAVRLPEGKKVYRGRNWSYLVSIDRDSSELWYQPGTNCQEIAIYINDNFKWTDLETAKKNLDLVAEKFNLRLMTLEELER